jgi:hypothetical protein
MNESSIKKQRQGDYLHVLWDVKAEFQVKPSQTLYCMHKQRKSVPMLPIILAIPGTSQSVWEEEKVKEYTEFISMFDRIFFLPWESKKQKWISEM